MARKKIEQGEAQADEDQVGTAEEDSDKPEFSETIAPTPLSVRLETIARDLNRAGDRAGYAAIQHTVVALHDFKRSMAQSVEAVRRADTDLADQLENALSGL